MNEQHPAVNFWKEVQNLDPTLAISEKCFFIYTTGELKRFSTVAVPLEEILTYTAVLSEAWAARQVN